MNDQMTPAPVKNEADSYPIQVQIPYPEKSSRILAAASIIFIIKMLLLIPHLFVLYFLGLFSTLAAIAAQFVVLVKGKYPENLFALVKAVSVWQLRVNSYMFGLTDIYPPLHFDSQDNTKAMTGLKKVLVGIVAVFVLLVILILLVNN